MTDIEFLEKHIAMLKELIFAMNLQPTDKRADSELKHWEDILKKLKALEVIKLYVDADSFSGLSPENKALLKEVL